MKRNQPSQRDQHLDRTHGEANMTITQPEPQLVEVPAPTKQELALAKRLDTRETNIAAREAAMKIKEQQYAEAVEAMLSSAKTELSSNGARVAFTTPFGVLRAEAYLDPIRQPAEARKAGGSFEKSSDDIVWLEPVNGRVRCEPFEIEF